MTLNPWQRKAQEEYPMGVAGGDEDGWYAIEDTINYPSDVTLTAILEYLAYERQECERCDGSGYPVGDPAPCPACNGTGLSHDYRKAQEWAERLGLGDV